MSHQLQLHGPAQRTTLPRGLHCEDYDSARGGALYSTGHRQHGRRQQNAKLRDRQRRPIRLRVMHDAMPTLRCLQPSQRTCVRRVRCLRCMPACDAYVCVLATAMLRACEQSAGRACIAGEAVLRETLTVHNCLRARAPASDVTLPMTTASMRCYIGVLPTR